MSNTTEEIKDFLMKEGADLVGFADLSGVEARGYPFGISIGIRLPKPVLAGIYEGPTLAYHEAYNAINAKLNAIVSAGAEFLIKRGYRALAQTTDKVIKEPENRTKLPHKTVAVRAGLGWIGKSNVLLTPEYGGAVRLSSLLTDAPVEPCSHRMESLCGACQICTLACPAGAIKGAAWAIGMDRDLMFDMRACEATAMRLSLENFGDGEATICGICFARCPFTQRYLKAAEKEE